MSSALLRPAVATDLPGVAALLSAAGLPTVGLEGFVDGVIVAVRDGEVVGAGGLEPAGGDVLLRSLVTAPAERGRGTGQALIARLVAEARRREAGTIWLLTETAAELFPRFGFRRVPRELAPAPLQALAEFAHACPASATALARRARPLRVLVVCTANAARSQLAEALLAHWGGDLVAVASAGSHPGPGPHPLAVATLAERGIAWEGKRSHHVDEMVGERWDLVITVCDAARDACPVFPGAPAVHWGLADPAAAPAADQPAAFRATAAALDARIARLLALPLAVLDADALHREAVALHRDA